MGPFFAPLRGVVWHWLVLLYKAFDMWTFLSFFGWLVLERVRLVGGVVYMESAILNQLLALCLSSPRFRATIFPFEMSSLSFKGRFECSPGVKYGSMPITMYTGYLGSMTGPPHLTN